MIITISVLAYYAYQKFIKSSKAPNKTEVSFMQIYKCSYKYIEINFSVIYIKLFYIQDALANLYIIERNQSSLI